MVREPEEAAAGRRGPSADKSWCLGKNWVGGDGDARAQTRAPSLLPSPSLPSFHFPFPTEQMLLRELEGRVASDCTDLLMLRLSPYKSHGRWRVKAANPRAGLCPAQGPHLVFGQRLTWQVGQGLAELRPAVCIVGHYPPHTPTHTCTHTFTRTHTL